MILFSLHFQFNLPFVIGELSTAVHLWTKRHLTLPLHKPPRLKCTKAYKLDPGLFYYRIEYILWEHEMIPMDQIKCYASVAMFAEDDFAVSHEQCAIVRCSSRRGKGEKTLRPRALCARTSRNGPSMLLCPLLVAPLHYHHHHKHAFLETHLTLNNGFGGYSLMGDSQREGRNFPLWNDFVNGKGISPVLECTTSSMQKI